MKPLQAHSTLLRIPRSETCISSVPLNIRWILILALCANSTGCDNPESIGSTDPNGELEVSQAETPAGTEKTVDEEGTESLNDEPDVNGSALKDAHRELALMEEAGLYRQSSDSPGGAIKILFDEELAVQRGFSSLAIELAKQARDYTNEVVDLGRSNGQGQYLLSDTLANNYPLVAGLDRLSFRREKLDLSYSRPSSTLFSVFSFTEARRVCGEEINPRPRKAGPRIFFESTTPERDLLEWGFHKTPEYAGGGYTLPKTYRRDLCGRRTYRDQGLITTMTPGFSIQYYGHMEPNGEPNPEVWTADKWPYPSWPMYVRWWHHKF